MTVRVYRGKLEHILPLLAPESLDGCVCDPPYNLDTIKDRFGGPNAAKQQYGTDGAYARSAKGFMGKEWDNDIAFDPETWKHVFRVLKPGAHLIAFSHARTYHRMVTAIEAAGFEIRDQIMWLYGTGFPKAHDCGDGWKTALKPGHEPIVLARKPIVAKSVKTNREEFGTGALNIEGCRVGDSGGTKDTAIGTTVDRKVYGDYNKCSTKKVEGLGRFPANVIHDGTQLDEAYEKFFYCAKATNKERPWHCDSCKSAGPSDPPKKCPNCGNDTISHPTIKPQKLMRYLCRLIIPEGGTVLDPFAGSGSTLQAARDEGFNAIGIEMEIGSYNDIRERLRL